ncbi:hypothetical protein [Cerasicoccus maritimus]|uniref:hypothetical protein n=1 Tax=Cerasicoccus maritimus TaxID=490089 RepID=UPI002852BED7|nr:hypothetical protein [Cerasicoccus maritimus]
MKVYTRSFIAFALASTLTATSHGTTLVSGFESNADGALVGQLSPEGQTWVESDATTPILNVSSGEVSFGATGQDASVSLGSSFSDTTIYFGFTLTMTAANANAGGDFFASLGSSTTGSGSVTAARLYATSSGATTGDYFLGGRTAALGGQTFGTGELDYGTPYRVVMAYTAADGTGTAGYNIYLDPTSEIEGNNITYVSYTRTGSTGLNDVGSFSIRQIGGNAGGISDLVVATTFEEAAAIPEVSTLSAFLGVSALSLAILRRRCKNS